MMKVKVCPALEFNYSQSEVLIAMESMSQMRGWCPHAAPPINTLIFGDLLQRMYAVYQSVVDIRQGLHSRFYESLARIDGDDSGALYAAMLERAELVGVIHRVDTVMLERALEQLDASPNISLSVNISPKSLAMVGEQIVDLIGNHANVAERLILEVLETRPFVPPETCLRILDECRALGVRLALDDFGCRHPDMKMLETVKPEIVKLHSTVIDDAMLNSDYKLLDAAMEYSWANDALLVAEHVDTQEKYMFTARQGIHLMQGYLFSRPVRTPPWGVGWLDRSASQAVDVLEIQCSEDAS